MTAPNPMPRPGDQPQPASSAVGPGGFHECVIRGGRLEEGWCFASPPGPGSPDVFVHISRVTDADKRTFRLGAWIRCRVGPSSRRAGGLEAIEAELIDRPPIEDLVARLERGYGTSCRDPASYRLDGLMQAEAKQLRLTGALSVEEYFAGMSMNGLRGIAGATGPTFAAERKALVIEALRLHHEKEATVQRGRT